MVFGPAQAASLRMNVFKLSSQNGRDNPQQLAPLLEAGLGISDLEQGLALHGHRTAGRENPPGPEIVHDIVQQGNFIARKKRKKMLKKQGKSGKNRFALVVRLQAANRVFVKNQDVSG